MHFLIAGDNLPVLSLLPEWGIDLIYTDPPYNIRSDGLPYTDRRKDWPEFMRKRLTAMHRALQPFGALALHIDEHELFRLHGLLAEVFGPENFVTLLTWQSSKGTGGRISRTTEFILVFSKDKQQLAKALPPVNVPTENAHHFRNPDNDPLGPWRGRIKAGRTREHRYAIEDYTSRKFVTPKYGWRHPPEKMIQRFRESGLHYEYREGRLVFLSRSENNGVLPRYYFKGWGATAQRVSKPA
jgi:hypothetical protein